MKPQGSSINKPGSKYSPASVTYNRALFKTGATDLHTLVATSMMWYNNCMEKLKVGKKKKMGKTCEGKPEGQWSGKWVGFKCPPSPRCLHECCGEIHGRSLGGVLHCSWPSSWFEHPSSSKTGLKRRGHKATRSAHPSFCSSAEQ
jgi:hypothetical protein